MLVVCQIESCTGNINNIYLQTLTYIRNTQFLANSARAFSSVVHSYRLVGNSLLSVVASTEASRAEENPSRRNLDKIRRCILNLDIQT